LTSQLHVSIEQAVEGLLARAVEDFLAAQTVPVEPRPEAALEIPRNPENGDWACSVALKLAKPLRRKPLEIAQEIADRIPASELIAKPEVAAPGFINLRVAPGPPAGWCAAAGRRRRFRPVGPIRRPPRADRNRQREPDRTAAHRPLPRGGHRRTRWRGSSPPPATRSIARITTTTRGADGELGKSLARRYLQAIGVDEPFPEDGYRGDYIVEIAENLKNRTGRRLERQAGRGMAAVHAICTRFPSPGSTPAARPAHRLRKLLRVTTLHENGKVKDVLVRLKAQTLYEKDALVAEDCRLWRREGPRRHKTTANTPISPRHRLP
jgi:arginyl-tRNA synthetase